MINQTQFKDKVAIVTGGGSGIGKETSMLFASYGAKIAVIDNRNIEGLQTSEMIKQAGGESTFFPCDVSDEINVKETMANIERTYGSIDYAYNNAGIGGGFGKIQDYATPDWDLVMQINLKGVFLCMKYEIPAMLRSGKGAIVNCASVLSTVCYENDSAYVASKFGVLGLTKNAALDYANSPIRINAVSPGFTYTAMVMKGDEQKIKQLEQRHPAGRLATAGEIANAVLWLCANESSFAIGHNLVLDGGYTLL